MLATYPLCQPKGRAKDRERSRNQCSHCWKTRFSDPRSVSKGLKGTLRFCTKGNVKEGCTADRAGDLALRSGSAEASGEVVTALEKQAPEHETVTPATGAASPSNRLQRRRCGHLSAELLWLGLVSVPCYRPDCSRVTQEEKAKKQNQS